MIEEEFGDPNDPFFACLTPDRVARDDFCCEKVCLPSHCSLLRVLGWGGMWDGFGFDEYGIEILTTIRLQHLEHLQDAKALGIIVQYLRQRLLPRLGLVFHYRRAFDCHGRRL